MDGTALIFRVHLGGERGRKLALRTFFEGLISKQDDFAFEFLKTVIPNMPEKDKEFVMGIVRAVTNALAYEDPED